MKMDYIVGIMYAIFDEKVGPDAFVWEPSTISKNVLDKVAYETVNMSISASKVPIQLSHIPFPEFGVKALVKHLQYVDKTRRGGAVDATLSLIFKEENDVIFYKYIRDYEDLFDKYTQEIIDIQESGNASKDDLLSTIKEFFSALNTLLENLYQREVVGADSSTKAFPDQDEIDHEEEIKPLKYKLIVCGDPAVGKTSLILQFTNKAFTRSYLPTLGVNISNKILNLEHRRVDLIMWDVAGQAKFLRFRKQFYSGAHALLIVCDLTNQDSFQSIKAWYEDIKKSVGDINGFIVGNKNDLVDFRKVDSEALVALGKELNLGVIETSALTGENVDDAFIQITTDLVRKTTESTNKLASKLSRF